jgi:hypothetical protein
MYLPVQRAGTGQGVAGVDWIARLATVALLAGCAATTVTPQNRPDAVPSHVYPLPLDNVLAQAEPLLAKKGWRVQRSGDVLFTNWVGGEVRSPQQDQVAPANVAGALVGYRIFGERIDAGFCAIRVERLVVTRSTLDYGQRRGGHQVEQTTTTAARAPTPVHNENRTLMGAFETLPEFAEDSANEGAATGIPSGMVLSHHERDTALETELRATIDPDISAPKQSAGVASASLPSPQPAALDAAAPSLGASAGGPVETVPRVVNMPIVSARRRSDFAGIWEGTFTFRGKVTGTFSGEISVAVDGDSVDIEDFCPEGGGTLTARSANDAAAWQGRLVCPAIRLKGCPAATFTYSFVNAMLNESTLSVVGAGAIETDPRCMDSGGEFSVGGDLSVAFVGQKADYVHIAVSKVKKATLCAWPSDWEDLASSGSMPMPEPLQDDSAYMGIIRARGTRLTEIQRLLRHCRQVVLLHGQPVLMRLAVTRPHKD